MWKRECISALYENTVMNNKTTIIISIIIIVLIGIVSIMIVKNSKSNKSSSNISENISKEEIVKESKFGFIYNYNELSNDWWNTINSNSKWKSIGYTLI